MGENEFRRRLETFKFEASQIANRHLCNWFGSACKLKLTLISQYCRQLFSCNSNYLQRVGVVLRYQGIAYRLWDTCRALNAPILWVHLFNELTKRLKWSEFYWMLCWNICTPASYSGGKGKGKVRPITGPKVPNEE
jgi:hypothetical protein